MNIEKIVEIINQINRAMNRPEITVADYQTKIDEYYKTGTPAEIETKLKLRELNEKKIPKIMLGKKYEGQGISEKNPFSRVFFYLLREEKSKDDIAYNKALIKKLQQPEEQARLLNEFLKKASELDPKSFFLMTEKEMADFYEKDPVFCEFLFASKSMLETAATAGLPLPPQTKALFDRMKTSFEHMGAIAHLIEIKGSVYYPFFPDLDENTIPQLMTAYPSVGPSEEDLRFGRLKESYITILIGRDTERALTGNKMIADGKYPKDFRYYRAYEGDKEISFDEAVAASEPDPQNKEKDRSQNVRFVPLTSEEKEELDNELKAAIQADPTDRLFSGVEKVWDPSCFQPRRFGITNVDEADNTFGLSTDRTALATIAIGVMLSEGYSFDDILDTGKLQKIRYETGQKVLEKFTKKGEKEQAEFGQYAAMAYYEVIEKGKVYMEKLLNRKDITVESILQPPMNHMIHVAHIVQDGVQELKKLRDHGVELEYADKVETLRAEAGDGILRSVVYERLLETALKLYRGDFDRNTIASDVVTNGIASGAGIAFDQKLPPETKTLSTFGQTGARVYRATTSAMLKFSGVGYVGLVNELDRKLRDEQFRKNYARNMLNFENYGKMYDIAIDPADPPKTDAIDLPDEGSLIYFGLGKFPKFGEPAPFDISNASPAKIMERTAKLTDTANLQNSYYGLPDVIDPADTKFGLRVNRTALATLSAGRLLLKGYRLNDILDPEKLKEERAAAGREALEMYKKGGDALGKYAAEGYLAVLNEGLSYVTQNVPGDLTTAYLLSNPKMRNLLSLGQLLQDAGQELERVKTHALPLVDSQEARLTRMLERQLSASFMIDQYRNVLELSHALYTGKLYGRNVDRPALTQRLLAKGMPAVKNIARNISGENFRFTDYNVYKKRNAETIANSALYLEDEQKVHAMLGSKTQSQNLAFSMLSSAGQENFFTSMTGEDLKPDYDDAVKPRAKQGNVSDAFLDRNLPQIRKQISFYKTDRSFWGLPEERLADIKVFGKTVFPDQRQLLANLVFSRMVRQGLPIDDVLDPQKLGAQRAKAREEILAAYRDALETGNGVDFLRDAAETYAAGVRKCIEYINEKTANGMAINDLFRPEMRNVMTVSYILGDAAQVLATNLNPWTGRISDCQKLLDDEIAIGSVFSHYRSTLEKVGDLIDGNSDGLAFEDFVTTKLLPELAVIHHSDAKMKALPYGKKLSDLTAEEKSEFGVVSDAAKEDLDWQKRELRKLLSTESGRRRFAYAVLNGQVGSALFKVNPTVKISAQRDPETREMEYSSTVEVGELKDISKLANVTKTLVSAEPMPVIQRKEPPKKAAEAAKPKGLGVFEEDELEEYAAELAEELEAPMSEEEMRAADLWFESLKEQLVLPAYGLSLNSSSDTARLRQISAQTVDNDKDKILTDTDFAVNKYGKSDGYDAMQLLRGQPQLDKLLKVQKQSLYKLAKQGKLVLNSADNNVQKMRSLYIKKDGTAGISLPIDEIEAVQDDKPERSFPDAVNGDLCKYVLGRYRYGTQAEQIFGLKSDKDLAASTVRRAWEADLLNDFRQHPLYYANTEQAKRRSDLLLNNDILSFDPDCSDRAEREVIWKKHQPAYSEDIEAILFEVAKEHFPKDAEAIQNTTIPDMKHMLTMQMFNKLFGNNLVGGPGTAYAPAPGDDPWDVFDRVTEAVLTNKEVYAVRPDGKYYQIKMADNNSTPKLSKNPTQVIGPAQMSRLIETLEKYQEVFSVTTSGDSPEFTRMKECCTKTLEKLKSGATMDVKAAVTDLRDASEKYYFAKLDQSQNSTRNKRFKAADELRFLGNPHVPDNTERLKYNIAAKIVKSKSKGILKGNEFDKLVTSLQDLETFHILCEGKSPEQLAKVFAQSPATLIKSFSAASVISEQRKEQRKVDLLNGMEGGEEQMDQEPPQLGGNSGRDSIISLK